MKRAFEEELRSDIATLLSSSDNPAASEGSMDQAPPVSIRGNHNVTYVMPRGVILIGNTGGKTLPASNDSLSGSTTS